MAVLMRNKIIVFLLLPLQAATADSSSITFCPASAEQKTQWQNKLEQRNRKHRYIAGNQVRGSQILSGLPREQMRMLNELHKEGPAEFCVSKESVAKQITAMGNISASTTPSADDCGRFRSFESAFGPAQETLTAHITAAKRNRDALRRELESAAKKNRDKIKEFQEYNGTPAMDAAEKAAHKENFEQLVKEWQSLWDDPQDTEMGPVNLALFQRIMKKFDEEIAAAESSASTLQRNRSTVSGNLERCRSLGTAPDSTTGAPPPGTSRPPTTPNPPGTGTVRTDAVPPGTTPPGNTTGSSLLSGENLMIGAGVLGAAGLGYYIYSQNNKESGKVNEFHYGTQNTNTGGTGGVNTGGGTGNTPSGSVLSLGETPSGAVVGTPLPPITVSVRSPRGDLIADSGTRVTVSCEGLHPCPVSGTLFAFTRMGEVTFSNLTFTVPTTEVKLTFSAPGFATVKTGNITVTPRETSRQ
jgi:hypothetical protein